jgi:hypothetical protein
MDFGVSTSGEGLGKSMSYVHGLLSRTLKLLDLTNQEIVIGWVLHA